VQPQSGEVPSGERLRGKGRIGVIAGKTVWSMPERFACNTIMSAI